ncbi:type VI secretion system TssO [Tenacibaculum sp.]|uniref:type VI secretion system TssO n=1 Tax=Tenacibaculum sp. TaxID=1906242 RepID=UPI003D0A21EC
MKALNYKDRRKQFWRFFLSFSFTTIVLCFCFYATLVIAERGMVLIENKQSHYNDVFKKQAMLNFRMEELFKNLYSLKNKRRSIGEYRQMQKIITNARIEIRQDIDSTKAENQYYKIYGEFLSEIRNIQSLLEQYNTEVDVREVNKEQLEKCREKYKDLNRK